MTFVYILKSLKTGKYYYGCTDSLDNRLVMHNTGRVKSTKAFNLGFCIIVKNLKTEAWLEKEKYFFKSIDGYLC